MDLIFAWMASIASGFTPLVIKASSKSLVKNPWLFNVLWVGFGIPLVVVLAAFKGGGLPADWASLFLLSAASAGFYIFYTVSLYRLDVTTISPLFSLRTVFAVLLGLLFLDEAVSALGLILILVIVLASPMAAYNEKLKAKAFFQKNVFLVVVAMLSLALMGYFTSLSVTRNGYATTLLWQDILTLLMLLPTLVFAKVKKSDVSPKKLLPFVFLGFTGFIYTATATLAYAHNLALSSVIVSLPLSMVFAYLLSRVNKNYLEDHSAKVYAVRFAGAFIMVSCAIWLSFLR
jgi:drug/metabolite transporter (DMT)-like permease